MGSTPATSRALYADEDGKLVVRHVPFPEPQEGELLIKVLYSGVNPADTKIIDFFGLKNYVIGTEFCGEVLESKTLASTSFKAGDIVAEVLSGGQNPPLRWGTHQEFMIVVASWVWKVPENLPPQDAAGLSIVGLTAATGLFNDIGLPLPPNFAKGTPDEGVAATEGTLVIWGGATSVGMAAADRHWRGFRWAVENYGASGGYVPTPVRVFEGSGEDAIKEVYNVKNMGTFGKLVLKHPLK
ncbi:uncharacterized protein FMAN_16136 [Fusarium mangiferae]|uniref:Alcohol dehydrogenase-like N-terminal domain-containing protein n=1 Tax=Fusarium mangiferae TaxID=192010 RepID=A0A1L7T9L8_FUSMA|nr:uncharacterized protein FMAN_16136 [Fusarium mangiferae]CVK95428.1 uncharacterized protein FMAN_16136 [Fusarium mangiferae]